MARKPEIAIRYGAAHDDVTVDGNTFVRHKLPRQDQTKLRKIVVGALEKVGYFRKSERS